MQKCQHHNFQNNEANTEICLLNFDQEIEVPAVLAIFASCIRNPESWINYLMYFLNTIKDNFDCLKQLFLKFTEALMQMWFWNRYATKNNFLSNDCLKQYLQPFTIMIKPLSTTFYHIEYNLLPLFTILNTTFYHIYHK